VWLILICGVGPSPPQLLMRLRFSHAIGDSPNRLSPFPSHRKSMTLLTALRCSPHFASKKSLATPEDCTGLSSATHIQKYTSCRFAPKIRFYFGYNITIERSGSTGEAERVRWVYEWGGGSDSKAYGAAVSVIARTAHYQTSTMPGCIWSAV